MLLIRPFKRLDRKWPILDKLLHYRLAPHRKLPPTPYFSVARSVDQESSFVFRLIFTLLVMDFWYLVAWNSFNLLSFWQKEMERIVSFNTPRRQEYYRFLYLLFLFQAREAHIEWISTSCDFYFSFRGNVVHPNRWDPLECALAWPKKFSRFYSTKESCSHFDKQGTRNKKILGSWITTVPTWASGSLVGFENSRVCRLLLAETSQR